MSDSSNGTSESTNIEEVVSNNNENNDNNNSNNNNNSSESAATINLSSPSNSATPSSEAAEAAVEAVGEGIVGAKEAEGKEDEEVVVEEEGEEEVDPFTLLELGDKVAIESTKYGEPVAGVIYYRSGDLLRIKPTGFPNKLIDFARDEDTDQFLPEEGVTATYVLKKRDYEAFVEQQDLRVGQLLATITQDGEEGPEFRITAVDPAEDTITVKDTAGDERTIEFGGIGIPREEPFVILRVKEGPPEVAPLGSVAGEGVAAAVHAREADAIEGESKEEDEEGKEGEGEGEEDEEGFVIEEVGVVALPKIAVYREAKASEKRIPDAIQKIDALNDFLNMLDPREQKNPKALRAVRILVESLFNMKREITETTADGEIVGIKAISPLRLRDLLAMTNVPLGRAVVEIKKRLYTDEEARKAESDAGVVSDDVYFVDEKAQQEAFADQPKKRAASAVSTYVVGEEKRNIAFYMEEQREYDAFGRPWRPSDAQLTPFRPHRDTMVFRSELPEMDTDALTLDGYVQMESEETKTAKIFKKGNKKYDQTIEENFPILSKIRYGIERALTTTYRKTEKGGRQVLVNAEEAPMTAYLLFPQADAVSLGTTRSGSVALDSARAAAPRETMEMILEKHDGIQPDPTVNQIIPLRLDSDPATLGNYEIKDYVEQLDTPGLGLGDTYSSLVEFGLENVEMSQDVAEVLLQKVDKYQQQLIQALNKLREEVAVLAGAPIEPELNNLLPDEAWSVLEERIRADGTLAADLKLFDTTSLKYVKSDIAKVAFLIQKHNDLFQAVMGNNHLIMAQERVRAIRRAYRENLEVARILRLNELMRGVAPKPNKCEHVAMLATIRAIPDEGERFFALTKFFTKYQGKRSEDDNWIHCNLCERELLCVHERLQIQAYITPNEAERETIQKEIYIKFSGGVYQGNYICRHCGQPMREIALDTHIQFDDEGRPMMGRAELVDKDALRQEELDAAMGLDQLLEPDIEFTSETEKMYYNVLRELADRAGIPVPKTHYKKLIGLFAEVMKAFPSPEAYAALAKENPKLLPYSTAIARTLVRNAAALLIVDAQSAIPEYVFRASIPKVAPTFVGYPYSEDATDKRSIQYMAIVVNSIKKTSVSPWSNLDFKETKSKTRLEVIAETIDLALTALVTNSPIVAVLKDQLNAKRAYITKRFSMEGTAKALHDQIPATFLPKQVVLTGAKAAGSAEGAVVPEAVAATGKEEAVVAAWIQQGHAAAHTSTPLVLGSPYSEVTCCKSNITSPGNFWRTLTSLPPLPLRQLGTARQPTIFQPEFRPRPLEHLTATVPADLTYRLFLKVCYDGPRKGELHEPGLTHLCPWCGFQFPGHPAIMDDTEGKAALEEQGIDTSMPVFLDLLDTTHNKNAAEKYPLPPSPGLEATLNHLLEMDPVPTADWKTMVTALVAAVRAAGRENEEGLLEALGPISTWNQEAELRLGAMLEKHMTTRDRFGLLTQIRGLNWANFCEVLQAYFLVPSQQILSGFNTGSIFLPKELEKEISQTHAEQIVKNILAPNFRMFERCKGLFKGAEMAFARGKLEAFVEQIRGIYALKNKIRPIYFPGREHTFRQLQSMMFLGPLLTLFDEKVIPGASGYAGAGAGAGSGPQLSFPMNSLYAFLNETLKKYQNERLGYNDTELRLELEVRREREKAQILSNLTKMSQEERRLETTMMRLGIGKYAVGGTSAIYKYSKGQFDVEMQEREEAGIQAFSGYGPDMEPPAPVQGGVFDMSGMTEEQRERDGGYDAGAGDGNADDE